LSLKPTLQALDDLINIHEGLIDISEQKTNILKAGTSEELQKILIQEQSYIHKLELAERKRERVVRQWFAKYYPEEEELTVTRMLAMEMGDDEKKQLETSAATLTHLLTELKRHEQLNAALIKQSRQFIQISLNLLKPSIHTMNYKRLSQVESQQIKGQSVFDSKA